MSNPATIARRIHAASQRSKKDIRARRGEVIMLHLSEVSTMINMNSTSHIDYRQYNLRGMNTSQTLPLTDLSACCSLGTGPLSDNQAERYAELFKVLADPTRLHILAQLGAGGCGPVTVGELTDILGIAQPMVSHHLKNPDAAASHERYQQGRTVKHTIQPHLFAELRTMLQME